MTFLACYVFMLFNSYACHIRVSFNTFCQKVDAHVMPIFIATEGCHGDSGSPVKRIVCRK